MRGVSNKHCLLTFFIFSGRSSKMNGDDRYHHEDGYVKSSGVKKVTRSRVLCPYPFLPLRCNNSEPEHKGLYLV